MPIAGMNPLWRGLEQVEALEDEAELTIAQVSQGGLRHALRVVAVEIVFPLGGPIETAEDVHES